MVVRVVVAPNRILKKKIVFEFIEHFIGKILTKSSPNNVHVCCIIFASHFSFGSGGGVPAIGCGLGRVAVPVLFAFFVEGRGPETFYDFTKRIDQKNFLINLPLFVAD